MKRHYIFILIVSIASYYSKSNSQSTSDPITITENEITYTTHRDQQYLYLDIKTDNKKNMMLMLKEGVTVYFDIKGKKKKNVSVQYPEKEERQIGGMGQQRQERRRPPEDIENQSERELEIEGLERPKIQEIIENLSQKGIYTHFDLKNTFHRDLNNLGIDVSFSEHTLDNEERGGIIYRLRIPKEQINSNPKKDLSKLSIGVIIGREKNNTQNQDRPSGRSSMSMGGGQSRGGGGPPGGGGGGGRSQGGSGGGPPNRNNTDRPSNGQQTTNTLEFWFDAGTKI
ncbi:hypothetical protein [Aquimarina pacifica]|uniref:hypothetical protein n=1 Tax=Aquimarina pacifica TaxID=1296415 RepID=UPI000471B9AF|nr:hypothetical protein [Aquimarina pacifica]